MFYWSKNDFCILISSIENLINSGNLTRSNHLRIMIILFLPFLLFFWLLVLYLDRRWERVKPCFISDIAASFLCIDIIFNRFPGNRASQVARMVKNLPVMQETTVRSLGWEDPLEKGMATHSSILAWRIPWTEEPGGVQSMVPHRVGHDWVTNNVNRFINSLPFLACLKTLFLLWMDA